MIEMDNEKTGASELLSVATKGFLKGLVASPQVYVAPLIWAILKISGKSGDSESSKPKSESESKDESR